MKRLFFTKQFFYILLLASFFSADVMAWPWNRGCGQQECCDYDSDCGSPLNCGFNVAAYAGVAPIIWTKRDCFQIVSCNAASQTCAPNFNPCTSGPILNIFEMPKFSKLFKTPWTVGGKVGYALSNHTEVYVEANYRQAKNRCATVGANIDMGLFTANTKWQIRPSSKFKFWDIYLGLRYYGDRCWWCEKVAWFVGIQAGYAHYKAVKGTITTSSCSNTCAPAFTTDCFDLFRNHGSVAAGANIGLDYCWRCGLSFIVTVEFLATCGARGGAVCFNGCDADVVLPEVRPTNFFVGGSRSTVIFPVTFGLKYNF